MSEAYPHLVFEGFTSKLGQRVCKILKHVFPPRDAVTSRAKMSSRVVAFKNIDDTIEVRHFVFVRTAHNSVELSEVGPRFGMKLFQIRGVLLNDKDGDMEWSLKSFTRTSRKKDYL